MKKTTRNQAKERSEKYYFTGKPCIKGHISKRFVSSAGCFICSQDRTKDNREKCRVANRKHYNKNKEVIKAKTKAYYEQNSEALKVKHRVYWANNRDKIAEWKKQNRPIYNEANVRRKLVIKEQTPSWANLENIKEIYKNCPEGYHVDHIVPLRAKNVSGLHVENNLQYLTPIDNTRKSNTYEEKWIQKETSTKERN